MRKMRILVISEDEMSQVLIRMMVERVGFHSFTIDSIEQLHLAQTSYMPDLIMADDLSQNEIHHLIAQYAGVIPILVIHRASMRTIDEPIPNNVNVVVVKYPVDIANMMATLKDMVAHVQDDLGSLSFD